MRSAVFAFVLAAIFTTGASGDDKKALIVTAVTHESHVNEQMRYQTTPGKSTTSCTDTAIGTDCDTTTTPATTTPITTQTTDVTEKVRDSENMVYTIVCTESPGWEGLVGPAAGRGNCVPLTDGDRFEAEIQGTNMWVYALKGGNQGKAVKIKYKILDIRRQTPSPPSATAGLDECRGDASDGGEVWNLGRSLGYPDNEIMDAIQAHGVCGTLLFLRGEADGKIPPRQQSQAQAGGTAAMALAATSSGQEATAQSRPLSESQALAERFNQHERDFIDFAKSHWNDRDEYEISLDLSDVAQATEEYLYATNTLLRVYSGISSGADRSRVESFIKLEARRYSRSIEARLPEVNSNLANTKLPAVAATGDRMKQNLRDAKAFFDSLQTSLE